MPTMASHPFIFTRAALRELDRRAVEEFHIPLLVLMENAGRAAADAARRLLQKSSGKKALILAGPGNNGGDGLAAARHLHNAGIAVTILLLAPRDRYKDAAAAQLTIIEAMKLPLETLTHGHPPTPPQLRDWLVDSSPEDLLIDALFGTGLSRPPEGLAAEVITAANTAARTILAIDIPSGLDCDTGHPPAGGNPDAVIHAAETISFCGIKKGFAHGKAFTGKVTIADIGVPLELLRELSEAHR